MKTPLLTLTIVTILLITGCSQKQPHFKIGVSQCSNDVWRQKMNMEMTHEATMHPGFSLEFRTANDTTEKQIQDIQYFIDKKVDLIVISPNKSAPITPIVEKAYRAGIPIVLVDRKILSNQYTALIGADNYQIGKEVGNYAINLLNGKGNIVEICGLEGSSPALERHQGFYSIISKHQDFKIVAQADGYWLQDSADAILNRLLQSKTPIDLVYAHNDRMAVGARQALIRNNRSDIKVLGIDALPGEGGGIEQVLNNQIDATFIYPTGGDKIMKLVANILENKPFQKDNSLYTAVVDKTNARVLKLQSDEILDQQNKIGTLSQQIDTFVLQYTTQRYLVYSLVTIALLFVAFLIVLFLAYRSKNRLNIELSLKNDAINEQKNTLEQQRDQLISLSKQLEDATQAKLLFFTNISHEFRTPLTLIAGPVNSLVADPRLSVEQKRLLTLVRKNVGILLKLVDQIIDFRKYESGKLTLTLTNNNLKTQLIEWNDLFSEVAHKKHIDFKLNILSNSDFIMAFDLEKMERIYFNLLSNAFKFTPEKGTVQVSLSKTETNGIPMMQLEVTNSGKSISNNDLPKLFDQFYQVDSRLGGSGIGLALARALVELHNGTIEASMTINGMILITIQLPLYTLNDSILPSTNTQPSDSLAYTEELSSANEAFAFETTDHRDKALILVIDDNSDIRTYIKSILQQNYAIIEARDGDEGMRKAIKYVPDIVVSDVMMPGIGGVEMCRQLKEELTTSHIPIILLTAYSLDEQRIEGFESGADDYIAKPFNAHVLEVRIRNLIESRKRLKERFSENLFADDNKESITRVDKSFIELLRVKIEDNLSDSDLNVEDLGKNMGLSRAQLYRKVKALTNLSPNELLRLIRLKKAHTLLSSTELNIAEVAYDVGFTSPSYFAKCFKEQFDESPTDYLKRVRGS